MSEMPMAEGLQRSKAEFHPAKVGDDMRVNVSDIDAEQKEMEAKNLVKKKDLQTQLIDVQKKIDAGGPLVGTYKAIQALLEKEYDAATSTVLKNSTESSDTALMQ